ncbi:MAG: hypothetical protein HY824_04100 [Acidobacteria bacterium]|nr:hypothetical protein [Acidobacteriota bacterium]
MAAIFPAGCCAVSSTAIVIPADPSEPLRLEGNLGAMLEVAAGRHLSPVVSELSSDASQGGCGGGI